MIYCPQAPYLCSRWFAVDLSSICLSQHLYLSPTALLFLSAFVTRGLFNGQAAVQSLSAPFWGFSVVLLWVNCRDIHCVFTRFQSKIFRRMTLAALVNLPLLPESGWSIGDQWKTPHLPNHNPETHNPENHNPETEHNRQSGPKQHGAQAGTLVSGGVRE